MVRNLPERKPLHTRKTQNSGGVSSESRSISNGAPFLNPIGCFVRSMPSKPKPAGNFPSERTHGFFNNAAE